ncbi:hypothetical protein [Streptomyces chartreusis]
MSISEMVALLDEPDPIERAFQALVIEHPENIPSAPDSEPEGEQ